MMPTSRVVHSDPDILGETPVFVGTRVPMKTLLDYLEAGDSLEVFLDHFRSVSHKQAIAVLELAKGIASDRLSRSCWHQLLNALWLLSQPI